MNTTGYSSAKEKSEAVASILEDVSVLIGKQQNEFVTLKNGDTILPGLGFTSDAAALRNCAHDIEQGIFKIIVLGEFKHGKSTLLNAMLGGKTLPAKAAPCTAIVTMLVYGHGKTVTVYETHKETPRLLSWDAFKEEFQLTKQDQNTLNQQGYLDRFKDIEYAQMECLHPLCVNGVKLIDSPGLKENISRTRVTTKFLKQSQAVIFVLNATQILSEDERNFIENVFEPGRLNNVFFVVNRINLVDEEEVEEVKAWVKSALKHHFLNEKGVFDEKFYNRRVFFVNAKGALEARIKTPINSLILDESGVPALERELERFLTSDEKVAAALSSTVQLLSWIVAESREKINQEKASLEQPLTELENRREETEKILKILESKKYQIKENILSYSGQIKRKVYENLRDYITEMKDTWPQDSKRIINLDEVSIGRVLGSFVSEEAKSKILEAIERESKKYILVKLDEWCQRIPILIQEDINHLMTEVEVQVGDFELSLDRLRNVFARGNSEDIIDVDRKKVQKIIQLILGFGDISQMTGTIMGKGDWGGFFGRMLQQIMMFVGIFHFLAGPVAWISLFIVELIHVMVQHESLKERIIEKLGEKIYENLKKELPAKQNEIYQSVEKQFVQFAEDLTKRLQSEIDEARIEQDRIICQKRDRSFSAEKEKNRLDAIGNKIVELFNKVTKEVYGKYLTPEEIEGMGKGKKFLMIS